MGSGLLLDEAILPLRDAKKGSPRPRHSMRAPLPQTPTLFGPSIGGLS